MFIYPLVKIQKKEWIYGIKALREDRDITQKELAEFLNIAQNTYSQYENGKRDVPIEVLIKLCRYYQISADYILGLAEKK